MLVVGHPRGHSGTLTQGVVSAIRSREIGTVQLDEVQISAAISPGSSGSPIVSIESGEIIGIATRKDQGELINFAASIETLIAAREQSRLFEYPNWANPGYIELLSDPRTLPLVEKFNQLVAKKNLDNAILVSVTGHDAILVSVTGQVRCDFSVSHWTSEVEVDDFSVSHWTSEVDVLEC